MTRPRQPHAMPPGVGRVYVRFLLLGALLIVAWVLWSGLFKPMLLGLGVFSCAITVYLVKRMGYFDSEFLAFRYSWRLLAYWVWLAREIVTSSIEVARVVLARRPRVEPQVIALSVEDLEPVDQALLGNSITLTPGTLTLDVHDDRILVHALTREGAQSLVAGEMKRRVTELAGD